MCAESRQLLQNILDEIKSPREGSEFLKYGDWNYYRKGRTYFYRQMVIYAGTTKTIILNLQRAARIKEVFQVWNDATAKDFSVQICSLPSATVVDWVQIDTQLANIATDRATTDLNMIYPPGSQLRFVYQNYTAGKIVIAGVILEEL